MPVSLASLWKKFLGDITQRRMSSYVAVRLVLIAPLNCWRNSTPFWCKARLCTIKIDNFRTYHGVGAWSQRFCACTAYDCFVGHILPVKFFLGDIAQRRTSSYVAVRLVLIAPLNCWRNSTPFWCKARLCAIKIDNFRTYHGVGAWSQRFCAYAAYDSFHSQRFRSPTLWAWAVSEYSWEWETGSISCSSSGSVQYRTATEQTGLSSGAG